MYPTASNWIYKKRETKSPSSAHWVGGAKTTPNWGKRGCKGRWGTEAKTANERFFGFGSVLDVAAPDLL